MTVALRRFGNQWIPVQERVLSTREQAQAIGAELAVLPYIPLASQSGELYDWGEEVRRDWRVDFAGRSYNVAALVENKATRGGDPGEWVPSADGSLDWKHIAPPMPVPIPEPKPALVPGPGEVIVHTPMGDVIRKIADLDPAQASAAQMDEVLALLRAINVRLTVAGV